jgi:ABC-type amino acid transport substrate-binding protein
MAAVESGTDIGGGPRFAYAAGFLSTGAAMSRLAAVALLLLAPALAAAQPLEARLKKIKDTKTVAIAYRTDALPFSFEDERKQPAGYTVELCKRVVGAIEQQEGFSGTQIKWVPVTVQNRLETVARGQADMECGATTATLSRMKQVDFSSFTFVDGTGLLVKSETKAVSLADLGGKRLGVIAGTSNERALNEALKRKVINATVVPVPSRDDGLAQLEAGKIDAFASDKLLLLGLASKAKDPKGLALLVEDLSFEPYAIALPRGDADFRLAVNTALAHIYRSGAIGEIFGRWFGMLGKPGVLLEATFVFGALPE